MPKLLGGVLIFALFISSLMAWQPREERISNGMKLDLIEDHSFPLISVIVVVNAGSAYEDVFTNGLSHFLEHLIFDGTQSQSREQIWERFDKEGVYYNAFTRKDFVAFLITSPTEFIEDAVENQADMLLNSIIPLNELKKERKVVIEEMTKDRDKPEEVAEEFFASKAFQGTPYERPVIGYENTIRTVTRKEIFDFYSSHYVPNNMTAIVVGDFDPQQMKSLFERVYGDIPPKKAPSFPDSFHYIPRGKVLYRKYFNTERIYLKVGFRAPLWSEKEAPAFSLIEELLNREDGPLIKALTEGEHPVAQEVSCEYRIKRGLSAFIVSMVLPPSQSVDEALSRLEKVLSNVRKEGFPPDYVKEVERSLTAEEIYSTESYTYLGMFLSYWVPLGGIEKRKEFLERRQNLTDRDLKRAMDKFWNPLNYVSVSVEPEKKLKRHRKSLSQSLAKRVTFPNGLTVIALEDSGSPILAVHLLIGNRLLLEPEGKNGVSHFVMQMLKTGTKKSTKEELAKRMDLLGIRMKTVDNPYLPFDDYYNSKDYAYIRFEVLDKNRKEGAKLLNEVLTSPSFPENEIGHTRARILSLIKRENSSTRGMAREAFYKLLFGGSPLANPLLGDSLSVSKIKREDLIDYYKNAFKTGNLVIAIVGNATPDSLIGIVKNITDGLPQGKTILNRVKGVSSTTKRKVIQIERGQAFIYEGRLIPSLNHPDAIPLKVLSLVLSDRLHNELREKRGLAYRLGAGVKFLKDTGILYIAMGTRSKVAKVSENGIKEVIQSIFNNPPTKEEIKKNVNSYWGHFLRFHQRRINRAYYLSLYDYLKRGYQFDLKQIGEMRKVTPQDILRVAKKYLKKGELYTVIAGKIE